MSPSSRFEGSQRATAIRARIPGRSARRAELQTAAHQGAVLAEQRDQVGDRCQGDEVEVALGSGGVPADRLSQPGGQLPGDRRSAQLRERVSAQRRVEDRAVGELGARLMVIGDHHLHSSLLGPRDCVDGGDRAVDGEDDRGPALGQGVDRGLGEAIAVPDPIGNQPVAARPQVAQGADRDRRRADAVDVEIAVHA